MECGKQLQQLANQVINQLLDHGIIIHRYDAFSTNSIYLKLDYGVANSLRISDHTGKKHLAYRFNLILNETEKRTDTRRKYPMYIYPPAFVDDMVNDIVANRQAKQERYGREGYDNLVKKIKREEKPTKQGGFWDNAKEIKRKK